MFNTGIVVRLKSIIDIIRYNEIIYRPSKIELPPRLIESPQKAWVGLESIILDIIEFSKIEPNNALEFGVEFGYSTAALANYFKSVTGVDIFTGDAHAGYFGDIYKLTQENLRQFPNIDLIKSDYKDFIMTNDSFFDLIHVDIVHTYEATYECGLWSAEHSKCTIFHDTQSFPEVKMAVAHIAKITGKKFYNYRSFNGLGILI